MALDKFPTLIGQGFIAEKTPVWKTRIAEAQTGRERRNRLWLGRSDRATAGGPKDRYADAAHDAS